MMRLFFFCRSHWYSLFMSPPRSMTQIALLCTSSNALIISVFSLSNQEFPVSKKSNIGALFSYCIHPMQWPGWSNIPLQIPLPRYHPWQSPDTPSSQYTSSSDHLDQVLIKPSLLLFYLQERRFGSEGNPKCQAWVTVCQIAPQLSSMIHGLQVVAPSLSALQTLMLWYHIQLTEWTSLQFYLYCGNYPHFFNYHLLISLKLHARVMTDIWVFIIGVCPTIE